MNAAHPHRRRTRAPLPMRMAMAVFAASLLIVGALAAVNLYAMRAYDEATQGLNTNLQYADDPQADLDELSVRQQQTDAQFDAAKAPVRLLLPHIAHSIESNASISRTFSERIRKALEAQRGDTSSGATGASGQSAKGAGSGSSDAGTTGLTPEQRKQVEELLKANEATPQPSGGSSGTSTPSDSNSVKPW